MSLSPAEQDRRARQRRASEAIPIERRRRVDRIMRMSEMVATSGLSYWTIRRAAQAGELRLIKLSARAIGARESEFWAWIDSKKA